MSSGDVSAYLGYHVDLRHVQYQPEGPSASSRSVSRSSSQQAPVVVEQLRKVASQALGTRLVQDSSAQYQFTLDTLTFWTSNPAAVQKTLASMKQTAQNYSFGALLGLAGAVYAGRRTYVDYATLAKMPFWLRVAGTAVLVFAALFFANKAEAADKLFKEETECTRYTVQSLVEGRDALLGVKSKVASSPKASVSVDAEVPLFAIPKGAFRECLGMPELQALFNEKATQWMQATEKSAQDLKAMEALLFAAPTPLSRETLQFYHGDLGVQHFAQSTAQVDGYRRQYAAIPARASDREDRVRALVRDAMKVFATAAKQLIQTS